jgi:hypothetical protein
MACIQSLMTITKHWHSQNTNKITRLSFCLERRKKKSPYIITYEFVEKSWALRTTLYFVT